MRKTILLIAIFIAASSSFAFGQMSGGKAEQEIMKLNKMYDEAILRSDAAAAERILAEDFMSTSAQGAVANKMQEIAEIKSGRYKFEMVKSDNVQVRVYGDTAVVMAIWMAKGMEDGKPLNVKERYTSVFVKRKGRWQIVAEQGTTVE